MTKFIIVFSFIGCYIAQSQNTDSLKFDYRKIYSLALDGNIKPALPLLEYDASKTISKKDIDFKIRFEKRFKFETDESNFLVERKSNIDSLLAIFHRYWRKALLDNQKNYDAAIIADMKDFIRFHFAELKTKTITDDDIDPYIKKYIAKKGLFITDGIGKTGKFYDLLVWKKQTDTVYKFNIHQDKIEAKVVFMEDFITLGWEEYATLGKLFPGGWATKEAIFCVKSAYDLKSENFLISYLAHEGRHFEDYKIFPKLSSADLEYRAKLVELSLADKTIYDLIDFFINNANYESDNSHQIANFCAVRDLSKAVFDVDFEKDRTKWKTISVKKINEAAFQILQKNTKKLSKNTEKFIKK